MSPKPPPPPEGRPRSRRPAAADDPALARYLESLDLDAIDPEAMGELDPGPPPARGAGGGARLAAGAGLWLAALLVESSDSYQLHGDPWWLAALVVAGLLVAGLDGLAAAGRGGAIVWRRLGLTAGAPGPDGGPPARKWRPTAGQQRLGLLALGLGMAATLVWLAPAAPWAGHGDSLGWLAAVVAALVAGLALSRWLILQGEHDRARTAGLPALPPRPPPAWGKWATLAALVAGGWAALGDGFENTFGRFGRTGLGFGVGLGMAVWLANRVEESLQARQQANIAAAREAERDLTEGPG